MSKRRKGKLLARHDVSDLIGLGVVVLGAVREIAGPGREVSYEVPEIRELACAAVVTRCLLPARLRGTELHAIRHIADWTAAELAGRLGEKTSVETVSRWENEKQPIGSYAEKVVRLVVCEALCREAPGVPYRAADVAGMTILDPWRDDPGFAMPPMVFERIKLRREDRSLIEAWEAEELPRAA